MASSHWAGVRGSSNFFIKTPERSRSKSLVHRDSASRADEVGCVSAGSEVEEGLSLSRKGDSVGCDEDKGTLHLVAAILDGLFAALHAADGHSLDVVTDSRQGSVADGQRVGLYRADDSAGSGQLLCILAGVLDVHEALEAVAGAGTGLTADAGDGASLAEELGTDGRILVRESGTEPVIRVMVEAASDEICEKYVDSVVKVIESEGLCE